jgi:hypothetical protein
LDERPNRAQVGGQGVTAGRRFDPAGQDESVRAAALVRQIGMLAGGHLPRRVAALLADGGAVSLPASVAVSQCQSAAASLPLPISRSHSPGGGAAIPPVAVNPCEPAAGGNAEADRRLPPRSFSPRAPRLRAQRLGKAARRTPRRTVF